MKPETTRYDEIELLNGYYDKVSMLVTDLKARLQARYEHQFPGKAALVRQRLEEADVLAWRTPYPHLFLPDFADEKIAELAASLKSGFKTDISHLPCAA